MLEDKIQKLGFNYLYKNSNICRPVVVGETTEQTEAKERAFMDGMYVRTLLLMPGGVSLAANCDGNWNSISCNYHRARKDSIELKGT